MTKLTRQEKKNQHLPDKDSEVLIIETGFFEMIGNDLKRRLGLPSIKEETARKICAYCNWAGEKGSCEDCSKIEWYPNHGKADMVRFHKENLFDPWRCKSWIYYLSRFNRLRLRLFGGLHD